MKPAPPVMSARCTRLEREPGRLRVAMEHLDGFQRELLEVLAQRLRLGEQVAGHRDDVAADLVGLDEVEDLARRRPDAFGPRSGAHDLDALAHDRERLAAGIGDAARENPDVTRGARGPPPRVLL